MQIGYLTASTCSRGGRRLSTPTVQFPSQAHRSLAIARMPLSVQVSATVPHWHEPWAPSAVTAALSHCSGPPADSVHSKSPPYQPRISTTGSPAVRAKLPGPLPGELERRIRDRPQTPAKTGRRWMNSWSAGNFARNSGGVPSRNTAAGQADRSAFVSTISRSSSEARSYGPMSSAAGTFSPTPPYGVIARRFRLAGKYGPRWAWGVFAGPLADSARSR